jgi:invasion protein IalB
MDNWIASPRPWRRVLTAAAAAAGLLAAATLVAPPAFAQNNKPAKSAQKKAPAAKPAQAQAPAQPAQPPQQAAPSPSEIMYSPWTKICEKGQETNNKQVCVVASNGRLVNGMPVVGGQIIEPEGLPKLLRVLIPIPVHVQNGSRILIDEEELGKAPFVVCAPQVGCAADYRADDPTIEKLKKGKTMIVQVFNINNAIVSLPLSLTDFGKAFDGPPIDPKTLEVQQRKLQEQLQKRAEEARKRLEAQQPAAAPKK